MSHRTQLARVLTAALLSGGCGTVNNLNKPAIAPADNPSAPVCRAYGGLREDWDAFWNYPWDETTPYADYVFIPLLAVGNFCFDVVGDTLTLPYTTVEEIRRALHRPALSSGYVPVAVPDNVPVAPAPPPATGTPAVTSPR
jgi:hypothetical protein